MGPCAARIRTGGRWRGFLSLPPLRAVHLQAFRGIAEALGAMRVAYFPDCEDVWEVFYEGGKYDDALTLLERYFGSPRSFVDIVASEIADERDHTIPGVWYSETVPPRSIAQ